jgi:LPXTG-motif cell wall-anchored protein
MKYFIVFFLFLLVTTSCDPVKRHNRLVEKYPYVHTNVTQKIHDTTVVYVPQVKHDTTVLTKQQDTVYIDKERLRIRIIREWDTLHIEGECKADTIIVTKTITTPLYQSTKTGKKTNWTLILIFIILFLSGIIYFLIKKR